MKDFMKKHLKKNTLLITLIFIFSFFTPNSSSAITGTIPQPVIGTAQGFYAGKTYAALFPAFATSWNLQPGEVMRSISISIYIAEEERWCGASDIDGGVKNLNNSTNKADANFIVNFTVPEGAANKKICAIAGLVTSSGFFKSAYTYATIAANPVVAASATPSVSASATPSVSASSTIVSEVMKPSGSKPSVSGTPVEGSKFKVSIKAWNMNGNDFEGRSVYLKLCGDSNCNNVINSYPVVETGTLNFDVAKTLTMPKVVGKAGQFVKVVDSVSYPALASGELNEDQLVELSSSIKKIEKAQPSSPSATPSDAEVVEEATPEATVEEMAQPTSDVTAVESETSANSLSSGVILGLLGAVVIALLIVIIVLLARKKK